MKHFKPTTLNFTFYLFLALFGSLPLSISCSYDHLDDEQINEIDENVMTSDIDSLDMEEPDTTMVEETDTITVEEPDTLSTDDYRRLYLGTFDFFSYTVRWSGDEGNSTGDTVLYRSEVKAILDSDSSILIQYRAPCSYSGCNMNCCIAPKINESGIFSYEEFLDRFHQNNFNGSYLSLDTIRFNIGSGGQAYWFYNKVWGIRVE